MAYFIRISVPASGCDSKPILSRPEFMEWQFGAVAGSFQRITIVLRIA
jgi:hypothetical protein